MIKYFLQQTGVLSLVVLLFACSSTNNKPLLIGFSTDSTAIVFSHVDRAGLLQMRSMGKGDTVFHQLISVLQTPSEADAIFIEQEIAGNIVSTDSNLVFIPITPFVKGRDYLVITHLNVEFGRLKDMLTGDLKNRIRPVQKTLTR